MVIGGYTGKKNIDHGSHAAITERKNAVIF